MELFKKKPKPQELLTKIAIAEKKLEKREAQLKDKRDKARQDAKNALKMGDERGFRVSSKRYGSLQMQLNTIGSMLEMAATMRTALEDQESLVEIIEIGKDLAYAQKAMGFDSEKIENAITNIRNAVDKVVSSSEMLQTQMETLTSPEVSREQEMLRAELIAELKAETSTAEDLEEKIKKEKEKEYEP